MKFNGGSLFVNTGRKPLSAMQRRKKNNRNNIFLAFCIAVIAVLCVFVSMIVYVWVGYDADEEASSTAVASSESADEKKAAEKKAAEKKAAEKKAAEKKAAEKKAAEKKAAEKKAAEKEAAEKETAENKTTAKKTTTKKTAKVTAPKYTSQGTASEFSKAADKAFSGFDGTYAYGMVLMGNGYKYINNTAKQSNSAALGAFLTEYICAKIYTGEFDYTTNVAGTSGEALIERLTRDGDVNAANMLIDHFTPAKLNAYMESKGYTSTHFEGHIGDPASASYTTAEDLISLMQNMYDKSRIFPYSDLYKRMRKSRVNNKIRNALPYETAVANTSFTANGETFDGGIVYSPAGNYIFVSLANGYTDDGTKANTAIAAASKAIFDELNK